MTNANYVRILAAAVILIYFAIRLAGFGWQPHRNPNDITITRNIGQQKLFPQQIVDFTAKLESIRYIKLKGWSFCEMLEGSTFDAFAHVYELDGSMAAKNPTHHTMADIIERHAKALFSKLDHLLYAKKVDHLDLMRFCCYFSSSGTNGAVNISSERLLHSIDPKNYFSFLSIESASEQVAVNSGFNKDAPNEAIFYEAFALTFDQLNQNKRMAKPKYKIAYQILSHEASSFDNLKLLIEKIDSPDSIILIHVDIKSFVLRTMLRDMLETRLSTGKQDNVHIQKQSFGVIWGHISLVHAQIEGFFELLDLAEWEYLINLSAYDWPLRSTSDIYESLKIHNDSNWIEYWRDSESSAARLTRPHIALEDYKGIVHASETGLRWWPFSTFHAYKQHQWMILHRSFVEYLRKSTEVMNVLAYMEHTWIPDESFFAIIAVNTPQFKDKIIANSRRYIKFEGGWHPIWIQWANRYEFLIGTLPDDGYFFVRKMNSSTQIQLRTFLDEKLFDLKPTSPCKFDEIGYRPECFSEILTAAAAESPDNSLILIPVNDGRFEAALNLYCSIQRLNMQSYTIFMSFDALVHTKLVERNILSYYNPVNIWGPPDVQPWHKGKFNWMMRQKPKLWRMLLDIGVSFWQFDADTVIIQSLKGALRPGVDIHISIDEMDLLAIDRNTIAIPNLGAGMMHFKNTPGTRLLVNRIQDKLHECGWMDDQEAINSIISTGVMSANPDIALNNFEVSRLVSSEPAQIMQYTPATKKPIISFLDQLEFVSGHYFLSRDDNELYKSHTKFRVAHANGREDKEAALKPRGLWLLRNDNSFCPFDSERKDRFGKAAP